MLGNQQALGFAKIGIVIEELFLDPVVHLSDPVKQHKDRHLVRQS